MNKPSNGTETRLKRRRCLHCRRWFVPKKDWQQYCSVVCGDKVRQRRRAERIKAALAAQEARHGA